MTGLEALNSPISCTQQVQVANRIEICASRIRLHSEAVFVQYAIGINHDCVFNAAAECEVVCLRMYSISLMQPRSRRG